MKGWSLLYSLISSFKVNLHCLLLLSTVPSSEDFGLDITHTHNISWVHPKKKNYGLGPDQTKLDQFNK